MWAMVKTRVPAAAVADQSRRDVHAIDPELAIWLGPFLLRDRLAAGYWNRALYGALFLVFSAMRYYCRRSDSTR